jgi:hypothetical protein
MAKHRVGEPLQGELFRLVRRGTIGAFALLRGGPNITTVVCYKPAMQNFLSRFMKPNPYSMLIWQHTINISCSSRRRLVRIEAS